MRMTGGVSKTRAASWALALASIAVPVALYLRQVHQFEQFAASREGYTCGMPLLAAMMISIIVGVLLSLVASSAGLIDYRDLPRPRATLRKVELLAVSIVWIGFVVVAVATICLAFLS